MALFACCFTAPDCKAHHESLVAQREQEMRVRTVRIVCAVVLSASVVIATVILYILIGRK